MSPQIPLNPSSHLSFQPPSWAVYPFRFTNGLYPDSSSTQPRGSNCFQYRLYFIGYDDDDHVHRGGELPWRVYQFNLELIEQEATYPIRSTRFSL